MPVQVIESSQANSQNQWEPLVLTDIAESLELERLRRLFAIAGVARDPSSRPRLSGDNDLEILRGGVRERERETERERDGDRLMDLPLAARMLDPPLGDRDREKRREGGTGDPEQRYRGRGGGPGD
jgi:hypothetical protein